MVTPISTNPISSQYEDYTQHEDYFQQYSSKTKQPSEVTHPSPWYQSSIISLAPEDEIMITAAQESQSFFGSFISFFRKMLGWETKDAQTETIPDANIANKYIEAAKTLEETKEKIDPEELKTDDKQKQKHASEREIHALSVSLALKQRDLSSNHVTFSHDHIEETTKANEGLRKENYDFAKDQANQARNQKILTIASTGLTIIGGLGALIASALTGGAAIPAIPATLKASFAFSQAATALFLGIIQYKHGTTTAHLTSVQAQIKKNQTSNHLNLSHLRVHHEKTCQIDKALTAQLKIQQETAEILTRK